MKDTSPGFYVTKYETVQSKLKDKPEHQRQIVIQVTLQINKMDEVLLYLNKRGNLKWGTKTS